MRARPDVDVRMPTVVHPGDEVDIEMDLESHSETPIDFVDLALEGEEIASSAIDGNQQRREVRSIVSVIRRLRNPGTLEEGRHPFRVHFEIPLDAPPSYLGVRIEIRYEIRLHISIPVLPDLRETYELLVEPHAAQRPEPRPVTMRSTRVDDAVIELSLSDSAFAPNDEIAGAFAVGNARGHDGLGVEISLVGTEHAHSPAIQRRGEQFRFISPAVLQPSRDGGEVPFRLRVPKDVVPSFASPWCKLEWSVVAALRTSWVQTTACAVPLHIGRYNLPHDARRSHPEVGAARWLRIWAEIGEKHGFTLIGRGFALEGSRGLVSIRVELDGGDASENTLAATFRYASLELGLRIAPQFLIVLPTALELLLPAHKIECRDLAQTAGFLGKNLIAALRLFKTTHLDDTRASVRLIGFGQHIDALDGFLVTVSTLAVALSAAFDDIPPPTALLDALPAWRAFASETGARLHIGCMAIRGASVDGAVFDILMTFDNDGSPSGTRIELPIDPPLTYTVHADGSESFTGAPPGSPDYAAPLRAVVKELAIRPHVLTSDLASPLLDPADFRPRLVEMLVLAKRLRGDRTLGPYR